LPDFSASSSAGTVGRMKSENRRVVFGPVIAGDLADLFVGGAVTA